MTSALEKLHDAMLAARSEIEAALPKEQYFCFIALASQNGLDYTFNVGFGSAGGEIKAAHCGDILNEHIRRKAWAQQQHLIAAPALALDVTPQTE